MTHGDGVAGDLADDVDPAHGVAQLDGERLARRPDTLASLEEALVAGERQGRAEELERDRLLAGHPTLQRPLLADGQGVGEQVRLVDGSVAAVGEAVGDDEVGVEERPQHEVGQVRTGLDEQLARLDRRHLGDPLADQQPELGAQVVLEAGAGGEEELELQQVAHPLRLLPAHLQLATGRQLRTRLELADGEQRELTDGALDEDVDRGVAVERGDQVLVVADLPDRLGAPRRTPSARR